MNESCYDVAIIGGGVVGAMTARQMAKYRCRAIILEKEGDVAMGQSRANSGIVHAGYDPVPGSLKARLNVAGSEMMEETCRQLGVKYRRNGTLVVGYSEEDRKGLEALKVRGMENGVKGLAVIDGVQARKIEPHLTERVTCALYAPTGAIVCPYELTIGAIGNAMDNGVELALRFKVASVTAEGDGDISDDVYRITAEDGRTIRSRFVVNCAGIHSDEIAAMVGDTSFHITPRYGEYMLLDKEAGWLTDTTLFRIPGKMGKGVLAIKTVDGNILLGPTSVDGEEKENHAVTGAGLSAVRQKELEFFDQVPFDQVITQFAGARAHGSTGDFIINSPAPHFINAAGIESPGLSSAPAIGVMIGEMLLDMGLEEAPNPDFNPYRNSYHLFKDLPAEEKNRVIAADPSYGRIVCRCEEVTEGEIIEAIRRNPGARDVDGVKRRTRSGMGRCQGGFCMPLIVEILARELGIPFEAVTKFGGDSFINMERTKGGGADV